MNTYWISLPCDLLSSLASFQCSLLHHLHLSSDLGLSKYVNQHSHLNLSRNVCLSVLYDLDFNNFDIAFHVMSLSRFRAQPRKGHLDRAKRIVGCLLFLPDVTIRFRTGEPDFSSLKDQEYDWTRSVYSGACEQIPHDIPKPLGKHVQTIHYVDANLHDDLATGKAVTAALHFLNQTPIDPYTKRQSTVETATYGSEFVAARTAVDQIIDIRTTLR